MATHSLNPDKNHRTMKKAKRKLDLRIKAYEEAVKGEIRELIRNLVQ